MAEPMKEVTFMGWLEDIFKLPVAIPRQTYAVFKTKYETVFLLQTRVYASSQGITDADVVRAFTEGPEALADIKGVTTTVNLVDLVRKPSATINLLGRGTINDIFDLDEISQDRRGDVASNLVRGQTTNYRGKYLNVPDNLILQAITSNTPIPKVVGLNKVFPFRDSFPIDTTTGKSRIQLLKDANGGMQPREDWEDRRTIEEGESRTSQYRTYAELAGALTGLSRNMENIGNRINNRDEANMAYTQSLVREMGINLDSVLDTERADKKLQVIQRGGQQFTPLKDSIRNHQMGSLHRVLLENCGGDINQLLANDAYIANALNITIPRYAAFSNGERAFLKSFLSERELDIRYGYKRLFGERPEQLIEKWRKAGLDTSLGGTDYDGFIKRGLLFGDLEHERSRLALEAYLKGEAAYKQVRKSAAEEAKKLARNDPQWQQAYSTQNQALMDAVEKDYSDRALDRLRSAKEATEISNQLFFSATTKEMLEAIEGGNFVKVVLINSRMLGALPFVSKRFRSPSDLTTPFLLANISSKLSKIPIDIAKFSGMNFAIKEPDVQKEATGMAKALSKFSKHGNGGSFIEWEKKAPNAQGVYTGTRKWHMKWVSFKNAQGIFDNTGKGSWGVYDVISRIDKFGLAQVNQIPFLDPRNYFSNFNNLDDFYNKLSQAARTFLPTTNPQYLAPAALPANLQNFRGLVSSLGLDTEDAFNLFQKHKQLFDQHGKIMLQNLPDLQDADRYQFLFALVKQGKSGELVQKYIGILNKYNRIGNIIRNYLYKNVLFGNVITDLPLIGKIYGPIQAYLRGIGMSDEIGLISVFKRWRAVRRAQGLGRALSRTAGGQGTNLTRAYIAKLLGQKGLRIVTKIAARAIGKVLLKTLGFILANAAGIITGGVSYVLTAIGSIGWATIKGILTGKGFGEAKEKIKKVGGTIKKVIIYPIMLGCGCLLMPIFIVILVGSILTSLGPFGGGAYQDIVSSQKISVTKEVNHSVSGRLTYTITVANISLEPVEIIEFNDRLTFTYPCNINGGQTVDVTSDPSLGTTTIPTLGDLSSTTIPAGDEIQVTFTVNNIAGFDGTYLNSITVRAADEEGRRATDSVSTDIGAGGCAHCPGGWPTPAFTVTQGPMTTSSHAGAEAIDLASSLGNTIAATHNGTAYGFADICGHLIGEEAHAERCGYGNYVEVISPKGFKSIYAHMSSITIANGQQVNKGDELGKMGTSGYSTGVHVHYEFVNRIACIEDIQLRMINIPGYGDQYIPETIDSCVGAAECGLVVP